jgi:hypothetical protein
MKSFWTVVTIGVFSCASAAAEKQLKPGESDIYNQVVKDLNAQNFTKAVTDLDTWQQKFPDSDYQDDRTALYVQSYAGANQPEKALDAAAGLLSKDLNAAFTGAGAHATIIRILYNTVSAVSKAKNPTASELSTGTKAANLLLALDKPLPDVSAEQWAEIRKDLRARAEATLLYIAMLPGTQAMAKQPPDCAAAVSAYTSALAERPQNAAISYELGRALNCEAKADPAKVSAAVYEFVRVAVIDPTLGDPRNDAKKIQAFADSAYTKLHGSADGLAELKLAVKQSPLPPADFKIKTADEIAAEKQVIFEKDHPQLALWMTIKGELSGANGEQYFEDHLKDAAVPPLAGTLVEAKPACRPKELLIAVTPPEAGAPAMPEIALKFEKPLTGKPELNATIQFEGVPSAFAKEPFLLTMDSEVSKIEGLKLSPCAVTPARKR